MNAARGDELPLAPDDEALAVEVDRGRRGWCGMEKLVVGAESGQKAALGE
jgi:hypothetical protein